MNIVTYLQELEASKALSPYMLKMMQNHMRSPRVHSICPPGAILKRIRLQEQEMLTPLGVDEMAECCNSFATVPKPNGTV